MVADNAISRRNVNDFLLLGGIGPAPGLWRVTGPAAHLCASAVLGAAYSACEPRLPGPGWMKGVTFAVVENTLLWPLIVLIDRFHPAVRSGELPSYNGAWPFAVENLRHIAYGFTLGLIFDRITVRNVLKAETAGNARMN